MVLALLVVVALILFVISISNNKNFDFRTVKDYLFAGVIINGVGRTLFLTVLVMTLASLLSIPLALGRLSQSRILRSFAFGYVWIFRGTPVLVQLIFWFNLALVVPQLTLGIPGTDVSYIVITNNVVTPFVAALVGLALNETAYMAEIVRGGLLSVDKGQAEAAFALGLTEGRTLRRIVLPQAMRAIIPPAGNELITALKTTALVSIISFNELLGTVQGIYSVNYKTMELLIVASAWYLACTSMFSVGQYYVERRFARGTGPKPRLALGRRVLVFWRARHAQ
ncbi:MAG: amino acid ABC transporter permease [Candidatus Dormibacteraeota bacterium]|nr:amino acid ABC transporter permease [Candidatus Dormibacteraeota bacterium]